MFFQQKKTSHAEFIHTKRKRVGMSTSQKKQKQNSTLFLKHKYKFANLKG